MAQQEQKAPAVEKVDEISGCANDGQTSSIGTIWLGRGQDLNNVFGGVPGSEGGGKGKGRTAIANISGRFRTIEDHTALRLFQLWRS